MKKIFLFLLLSLFIANVGAAEYEVIDSYKDDWTNFEVKGRVESISHEIGKPGKDLETFSDATFYSETYIKFNKKGFCSFIHFKDLGSQLITYENSYSYHSQTGQRIMFTIYAPEGMELLRKRFVYDEKGKIVAEEITYPRKSSKVADVVEYQYNDSGILVKKVTLNHRTKKQKAIEEFTYNEAGLMVQKTTETSENDLLVEKWSYNDKGKVTLYEKKNSQEELKTSWEYHEDGTLFQETQYLNGKQKFRKVFHYEDGLCTAHLLSDEEDRLTSIVRLSYDAKGNYTQKVTFRFQESSKQIEVFQIERRKISYLKN